MGYIEESLAGDEALIAKAHFPYLYHVFAYGALLLFLAAAAYIYAELQAPWSAAMVGAVGLIIFLRVMVPIWTTEIGVTSERVILKRGFFTRHTDEIEISAIEEINIDQGFLGRLLGFGRITVQGTGDDDVDIPPIADPVRFRKSIQQALEKMRPAGPPRGVSRVT
jgi:uncharacterized membrane protein YdbT with pleckstrin-like domain